MPTRFTDSPRLPNILQIACYVLFHLHLMPGAHLIYDVRKHHISVFVFQESSLRLKLYENTLSPRNLSFNVETWSQGGLRYFVIGDANVADINNLAELFKTSAS